MGRTMDVEDALAKAKEEIAALRREKEQRKSEAYPTSQQEESSDQYKAMQNIGFALEMTDPERFILASGRNPDAYKMHEGRAGIIDREGRPKTEPTFTRRIGQPSAGRSAVLGEYRADPAWEAGFQSVLMNRDSYSLADLDGSGLRADAARDGVLVSRGDTDSLGDLGRSEALEFLEREAKKVERQSLIEGMQ